MNVGTQAFQCSFCYNYTITVVTDVILENLILLINLIIDVILI